jgi:hypothetical protein
MYLKANGGFLDLLPGTSVPVEINSPFFGEVSIPGSRSFPFTLPDSALNRQLLGHPAQLDRAGATVVVPAELGLDSLILLKGKLIYKGYVGKKYNAVFLAGLSAVAEDLKSAVMADVMPFYCTPHVVTICEFVAQKIAAHYVAYTFKYNRPHFWRNR